jgi:PhnB protein
MTARGLPHGVGIVTPYICVSNASAAIDFYRNVFGAREIMRFTDPDNGRIGHAELQIGGGTLMLSDEYPEMGYRGPSGPDRPPVSIHLYVEDVDSVYQRAIAAGATSTRAPEDQFYGDRVAHFRDPWGHSWFVATRIEDVPAEEMARRFEAARKD